MKSTLIIALVLSALTSWVSHSWTSSVWENKYLNLKGDYAQAVEEAREATEEKNRALRDYSHELAESLFLEERLRETQSRVIEKEVIRYVESPDAGNCNLTNQWVWTYDLSTLGMSDDPPSPPGDVQGDSGVTETDVLRTSVHNHQACREAMDLLSWWREWGDQVRGVLGGE